MSDEMFTDPNDKVEVEPPQLGPIFAKVCNRVLPAAWCSRAGQGILCVGAPADCRAD